jgi:hypothetical protein
MPSAVTFVPVRPAKETTAAHNACRARSVSSPLMMARLDHDPDGGDGAFGDQRGQPEVQAGRWGNVDGHV